MSKKVSRAFSLAQKIVSEAKKELNEERKETLKIEAKKLLEDIQEAHRTTNLLERQLRNFMRKVDLGDK